LRKIAFGASLFMTSFAFRYGFIVRLVGLLITLCILFFLGRYTTYYASSWVMLGIVIWQFFVLLHYVEQGQEVFRRFLSAIYYDDYTQTYAGGQTNASVAPLQQAFNKVLQKFQEIRADREAQFAYLQAIVQHIPLGLLVFDEQGHIQLLNPQTCKFLGLPPSAHNIDEISNELATIRDYLKQTSWAERELVRLADEYKVIQIALRRNTLRIRGKLYHIVSLQDIQSELDDKEMEAWQNLIRVLTHEIMNSVTPIISLAGTIEEDLQIYRKNLPHYTETEAQHKRIVLPYQEFTETLDEVQQAVQAIQRRSDSLKRFVQDFRHLTKIPAPQLTLLPVALLLGDLQMLYREEFRKAEIEACVEVSPKDLQILADRILLEQVLINLVKNAMQALENKPDKRLIIRALQDRMGKSLLTISDNGAGIEAQARKNLFVPFFTTKKNGSGIGLSFSRQVMRLHGGSIEVKSKLGEGTTFVLRFA
jgi:two-component system, NtrC family, nitrogen regulation sensor histidine kinase NtrY